MNVTTDGIIQNYVTCAYVMSVPNTTFAPSSYKIVHELGLITIWRIPNVCWISGVLRCVSVNEVFYSRWLPGLVRRLLVICSRDINISVKL